MNKTIIIDASVVAKWLLPDENDPFADTIKNAFINREITVAVPTLIFYEINNLLKSAAISKRISVLDAIDFYDNFLDLDFTIHWSKDLLKNSLHKALNLNISAYDASYIALAQSLQTSLFTADEKLVKKVHSKWVKSLEEYK